MELKAALIEEGIVLKSDQNGIEMEFYNTFLHALKEVKIRPKWDWNLWFLLHSFMHHLLLKSDQNGIEIYSFSFA